MKTTITITEEVEIKTLRVSAGVRYWEDSQVNGVEDTDGDLIPCREGDRWCPLIDIDSGVISNWTKGVTADIHYKVCDDGKYEILDERGDVLAESEGYVPGFMRPSEKGYGDYIIMQVDENGQIANWDPSPEDFNMEDED